MNINYNNREATCLGHIIVEMEYLIHFKGRSEISLSADEMRSIPRAFKGIGEACRNLFKNTIKLSGIN